MLYRGENILQVTTTGSEDVRCPECKRSSMVDSTRMAKEGRRRYRRCVHGHRFRTIEVHIAEWERLKPILDALEERRDGEA